MRFFRHWQPTARSGLIIDVIEERFHRDNYLANEAPTTFEETLDNLASMPKIQQVTDEQVKQTRQELKDGTINPSEILRQVHARLCGTSDAMSTTPNPVEVAEESTKPPEAEGRASTSRSVFKASELGFAPEHTDEYKELITEESTKPPEAEARASTSRSVFKASELGFAPEHTDEYKKLITEESTKPPEAEARASTSRSVFKTSELGFAPEHTDEYKKLIAGENDDKVSNDAVVTDVSDGEKSEGDTDLPESDPTDPIGWDLVNDQYFDMMMRCDDLEWQEDFEEGHRKPPPNASIELAYILQAISLLKADLAKDEEGDKKD